MRDEDFSKDKKIAASQLIKEKEYWLNKLAGELTLSYFPYDHQEIETEEKDLNLNTVAFKFDKDFFFRLETLTKGSFPKLHMILMAGLVALLHKYTGNTDIVVATPIDKQEIDGEFTNTVLALRNQLSDTTTFKELLLLVRHTIIEAIKNQNYPIETLLDQLSMSLSDVDFPLFDVALLLENVHDKAYLRHVKLNVIFSFLKAGDGLEGMMEYNPHLYKKTTIERIITNFICLLKQALLNLDLQISDIDLLSEEEKKRLIFNFNNTKVDYPRERCIHTLFEQQVEKTPDSIAAILTGPGPRAVHLQENSGFYLTFRELNRRANQLARVLRTKGLTANTPAAIMLDRSLNMLVGVLAILKAGGAYLPMDIDYPEERKRYMLEDSGTSLLITEKTLISSLKWDREIIYIEGEVIGHEAQNTSHLENINTPLDLVYIIYTSGSTGRPKGVMIEHRGVVNYIWWAAKNYIKNRIHPTTDFPLYTSISFDLTVTSIFTPLITGGKIVVYRGENKELLLEEVIDDNKVGIVKLTPTHLKLLRGKSIGAYSGIKSFIVGGEKLELQLSRDIYRKFHEDIDIFNEYGPTEAVVGCMIYKFDLDKDNSPSVPIGVPIDNVQIYILDKNQRPVIPGVPGEINISGDGLARGYLNRPGLTLERFTINPFEPGKRMYKTGDLARRLSDGNIEFLGRIDSQVKIRGFRIELEEIESKLSKHNGVKEVVVTARENENGEKYLCAYIVSHVELTLAQLREYLSRELPEYMVPSFFVSLEKIPLTHNGKIDSRALPEPEIRAAVDYIAPRNEVEELLTEVWAEILKVEKKKIGINSNFFELGGNSFNAVRAVSTLARDFDITITQFFMYQTIAELAENIGLNKDKLKRQLEITIERLKQLPPASLTGNNSDPLKNQLKNEYGEYKEKVVEITNINLSQVTEYKHILLTGATGYLGAYLLCEIINNKKSTVYLPVRGGSQPEAEARLENALTFHFGADFYNTHKERMIVVKSDLTADYLELDKESYKKLTSEIDMIVHAAANVRHFGVYSDFFENNVKATERLLEFSMDTKVKDFNYISTMSVCSAYIKGKEFQLYTECQQDFGQDFNDYYTKSKFEAEKLVAAFRKKGLNTSIFRVGNIVSNSETGKFQENISDSAFYHRLASIIKFGLIPGNFSQMLNFTFVDCLAKAIVLLFDRAGLHNQIFHLYNDNYLSVSEFVLFLQKNGENIEEVPLDTFYEYLYDNLHNPEIGQEMDMFLLHTGVLDSSDQSNENVGYTEPVIVCDRTKMFLQKVGFKWPKVNEKHIRKMIDYCREVNFL